MTLPIPHARVFTTEKQKVSNQLQNKVVVNLSREATNDEIKELTLMKELQLFLEKL